MTAPSTIPAVERFNAAVASLPQTAPLEALADDAFLSMWKLRDHLVRQDRNAAACKVDKAMEHLQAAIREVIDA